VTTNKPTCAWTARTNVPWLDLGGQTSGPGNGGITWSAALTLSARVGDIFLENTDAPSPLRCVVSQGGILPGVSDAPRGPLLKSRLDVERARAQVVVDGAALHYVGAGEGSIAGPPTPGLHRVVGQLVEGSSPGRAGQWRFELSGPVEPGSLQAAGGEVVLLTDRAIAFRLAGKPGERVVFTFHYR
jgi:hypothetical protein